MLNRKVAALLIPHSRIHFGTMSLVLAAGLLQGVVVLVLLLATKKNRAANRLLAALLAVSMLRLLPYVIGYAGVYDAYPWLSFAPYNLSFAFGPLVWLYVRRLTSDRLEAGWSRHLWPAGLQFCYYAVLFPQTVGVKSWWNVHVQRPWVNGPQLWLTLLSATVYLVLAARQFGRYQAWLKDAVSYAEELRMTWLRGFLLAFGLLIVVWSGFAVADRVRPLSYFGEFPLYVVFAAFVYYLGLEGWRHAGDAYPLPVAAGLASAEESAPELESKAGERWRLQGQRWLIEIEARELWRDPELSSAALARALGTNTSYLSKGLNEGLGQSFSECINQLRVSAVERVLREGAGEGDLLGLALASGFHSKASFNRAFKKYTGRTPSEYRSALGMVTSQISNSSDI